MSKTMILIEVASRQDESGKWIPLRFRWKDMVYEVKNIGRRWQDEVGDHMLVMTYENEVYELFHSLDSLNWFVKIHPTSRIAQV